MKQGKFVEYLNRLLQDMHTEDSHALVHLAAVHDRRHPRARQLVEELNKLDPTNVQFADSLSGDLLFLLQDVNLDSALDITRRIRYVVEHVVQPHYELVGSFGLVCFDATRNNAESLLLDARRAANEAKTISCNQIHYLDQTARLRAPTNEMRCH